jgi:hypothetical protein
LRSDRDPPYLKIRNRDIKISSILYFSNTIPVLSIVGKLALVWYLIKWVKKSKEATTQSIKKEVLKTKKMGTMKKIGQWVFTKMMTFLLVKVHLHMYARMVFVFVSFKGFQEALLYNKWLAWINLGEGLFDVIVVQWIELKIYDFLRVSKKKEQLLMLEFSNIKSILMINVFNPIYRKVNMANYIGFFNLVLFI